MAQKLLSSLTVLFLITTTVFTFFLILPSESEATELEPPGYALIAAPFYGNDEHYKEAEHLRNYLLENGWDDDHIIFLGWKHWKPYCDGLGTKSNLENAITEIANTATPDDIVFLAILDHGQDGGDGHTYFRTGDRDDIVYIKDTEFDGWVDGIESFDTMVIYIGSPYSGGFVGDLEGDRRIIISDCGEFQSYRKSEYNFHKALTEAQADTNSDGRVSVEEAYSWMDYYMEIQDPVIYDYQQGTDFFL